MVARNIEKLNQVKENILNNRNNINIKIIQMDVSTPENCKNLYNQVNDDIDILINEILIAIEANGIQRNFSILGGEPMAQRNISNTLYILEQIKKHFPNIKTYVWTGYTIEELLSLYNKEILQNIDVLIDGRFILAERDITLKLRGSKNQRILYKGTDF